MEDACMQPTFRQQTKMSGNCRRVKDMRAELAEFAQTRSAEHRWPLKNLVLRCAAHSAKSELPCRDNHTDASACRHMLHAKFLPSAIAGGFIRQQESADHNQVNHIDVRQCYSRVAIPCISDTTSSGCRWRSFTQTSLSQHVNHWQCGRS
ncbi:uncharacterized protein K489DRAFT_16897 [Dissoconium aciculare CBS 342.82]|uniref:Uncharacterized protein n=1 Tax=Dissoconium aciculare CBS 342.82 TaxID=1314786 RepID=A0A6J3MHN7_9PEZI|nr:uncharacterized protein K489DRAFT_16897 [Dissoconium aciculare CBS 342.82]KAF1827450.1 hypothetical protein K489DRAFT_16897 [Dissoconium aciculare CBS 342.82]